MSKAIASLPWKKVCSTLGSCASLGAGVYIYLLIPSAEPQNVGEVLNRAGFEGIEKASTEDLMKIVKAYKETLKSGKKFEKMKEVEVDGKSDEEIGEQIKGGCRRIAVSGVSSVNKDTGRRFCVVPVTVEETLKKQGIRFLDVNGHGDDKHWETKVNSLIESGKANETMKNESNSSRKVEMIKASCRDLKTAPTTSGGFNSFLTVATTYCSIKGK